MSTWHIELGHKPACEYVEFVKAHIPCEIEINEFDIYKLNSFIMAIEKLFVTSSIALIKGKCPHTYPKNLKELVI
jgi:hypothetical protein